MTTAHDTATQTAIGLLTSTHHDGGLHVLAVSLLELASALKNLDPPPPSDVPEDQQNRLLAGLTTIREFGLIWVHPAGVARILGEETRQMVGSPHRVRQPGKKPPPANTTELIAISLASWHR